ncbi:attachment protein, partial [Streptomyces lunaelactis]|nr:attachment protein [Streptomyces lunaelactis]
MLGPEGGGSEESDGGGSEDGVFEDGVFEDGDVGGQGELDPPGAGVGVPSAGWG